MDDTPRKLLHKICPLREHRAPVTSYFILLSLRKTAEKSLLVKLRTWTWEKDDNYHRARRATLPSDVSATQLFILWIVSAIRFDAEGNCTARRSHLLCLQQQLKDTPLLERVYFGWCDFLMSRSRSSLLRSRAEREKKIGKPPHHEYGILYALVRRWMQACLGKKCVCVCVCVF